MNWLLSLHQTKTAKMFCISQASIAVAEGEEEEGPQAAHVAEDLDDLAVDQR